ncbi:MAG: 50S ribosomal protein L15 [Candidatus Paceibacterota bacterium]
MQINDLKPKLKKKGRKRVGRGGKRGTYSGRGIKGQKARAGRKIPSQKKEMISKFPKLKGLKNPRKSREAKIFNVSDLERYFKEGSITKQDFLEKRLVNKRDIIKILGKGDLSKKFEIKDIKTSKSAKEKIEKAGGKVVVKEDNK